jgi:hypothetical protein
MSSGGVTLSEEQIRRTLSRADLLARDAGDDLRAKYPGWVDTVHYLSGRDCPKTYLPVTAILLTARCMKDSSELDVLDIQQQTSSRGYAASSIGRHLIPFATEQGIDLRSKSSQVLNNQPFTFKKNITPGMTDRKPVQFARFYEAACAVNELKPHEAHEVLALLFHLSRAVAKEAVTFKAALMDWNQARHHFTLWARFTDENSDNGKVGLVFVASMLELVYGEQAVAMGQNWDPDVTTPGDVQVLEGLEPWLWTEVKQKPITTGDVQAFCEKVRAVGGGRILYCALANANYRNNLDHGKLAKLAASESIDLTIVESPSSLMDLLLPRCPGLPGALVARMAGAMTRRLAQADVSPDACEKFETINNQLFPQKLS